MKPMKQNVKWTLAIVALIPVGVLAAGAAKQKAAANQGDFRLRYEWRTGSVPPQYHYETSVLVRRAPKNSKNKFVGTMLLRPGYPVESGPGKRPEWSISFPVAPASIAKLRAEMKKRDLSTRKWIEYSDNNRPVGGGDETLEVTDGGHHLSIPGSLANQDDNADADAIYTRINALVPAGVRANLEARRAKYAAQVLTPKG